MTRATIESIPFNLFQFEIMAYLEPKDHLNMALVNQYLHSTQLPNLIRHRVFVGNSTFSQVMLAFNQVIFTDHAARTFHASMYEYALFSKDTKLQMLIEEGVKNLSDPTERSQAYAQLKNQYNHFMENGMKYIVSGNIKHFKIQENKDILALLIIAYEIYLRSPNRHFLVHTIGALQSRLPLHMLLEMTNRAGFMPKKNGIDMISYKEAIAKVYFDQSLDPTYHPTHTFSRLMFGSSKDKSNDYNPVNLGTEHALVRGGTNDAGIKPFAVENLFDHYRFEESDYRIRAMNGFVNKNSLRKDYQTFKKLNVMRTKELQQAKDRILGLEKENNSCTIC